MRLHRIDLNLLVVFEAIYREQNLTRAAQKLGLTQPAVSHALSRLRDLLGDPLFIREGRSMAPTRQARELIGAVRQALTTLEQGLFPSQVFDPATSDRRFQFAVRDSFEILWLPPLMAALRTQAPHIQLVSVRVAQAAQLETELAAGTVDLALDLPLSVGASTRHLELGQDDELCVVARRDHPALQQPLTLETYLAASHVIVSSRRRGPGLEDVVLRSLGHRRSIAVRCQSHLAAAHVAAATDLLLTMPTRMAQAVTPASHTQLTTAPFTAPPLGIHLYWHSTMETDPANTWLRSVIAELAKKA